MTSTTVRGAATKPRLRDLAQAEWHKLLTTRSTMWSAIVAAATAIALSALHMRSAAGVPGLREHLDVVGASLFGVSVAQYVAAVAGVLAIGNEYASGTIRLSVAATPRRVRFLTTKLALTTGTSFCYGVVVAVVSYALGRLILGHTVVPLLDASAVRRLFAVAGIFAAMTVLGMGFGTLSRSTAGGLVATAALFVVPKLLIDPMSTHMRAHVGRYLPLQLVQDLVPAHPVGDNLTPGVALPVLLAQVGVLLFVTGAVFSRRDL